MFFKGGKVIARSIRILIGDDISSFSKLHPTTDTSRAINSLRRTMSTGQQQMYTAEYLSDKIKKDLDAERVDVEDLSNCGCGMKFDAVIVSSKFEGKPILQRQRLVNQTLAEEMKHIHAFTMRTLTPAQWKESASKRE